MQTNKKANKQNNKIYKKIGDNRTPWAESRVRIYKPSKIETLQSKT